MKKNYGLTRSKILKQYKIEAGRITSGKKFSGEKVYVPYYWNVYQESGADEEVNGLLVFFVTQTDKEEFPELKNVDSIVLKVIRGKFVRVIEVEDDI
jgi:hypothetical protein